MVKALLNTTEANINGLALRIQDQADRLFPNRTDSSMFLKLYSELGELIDSGTEEEFADVMIMLLDYGSRKMFNIGAAINAKMIINDGRTWMTSELGVNRHA